MKNPDNLSELGRVHFVGIGGSGMSGLARLMLDRGIGVSGSDLRDSAQLTALRQQGAVVHIGHAAANLGGPGGVADTVVSTPVIPEETAELVAARKLGIPILSRAQALALLLADHKVIGIGGTHGKTTTTSMIAVALQRCGADPSFAIGSEVNQLGSNAHTGTGDYFVVEADESDGAFLHMDPSVVVVTNVEPDHLDYWGDLPSLERGFADFLDLVTPNDGFAVVCTDQEGSAALVSAARDRAVTVITYGSGPDCDYRVEFEGSVDAGFRFEVENGGVSLGPMTLQVPGRHNALNATAALAVCMGLGFSAGEAIAGLEHFSGARRRFDYRGGSRGIRVYDDYAHHPTELIATLAAAREVVGDGRLIVAFQPHRYSRTAMFSKELGKALELADDVVVLEVYPAGEDPIPGASGQSVAVNVPLPSGNVLFEPSWSAVPRRLAERARPGDLIMTLGAGDISLLGPEVLAELRTSEGDEGSGEQGAGE